MEETIDNGFEEFFSAYDEVGDQTDTEQGAESEETTMEETYEQPMEASDGEENAEGENTNESEESAAEDTEEGDSKEEKRSFDNIKVNGEIRSVSYDDAPAWIQKGMDYDRVKGKLEDERQANQELRQQMEKHREALDMLELISGDTGLTMNELLASIHKQVRMQNGETEKEAEANIRAAKAERAVKSYQSQTEKQQTENQNKQDRAQREYAEFRNVHPDVKLDDALIEKLKTDVQSGMSILAAYDKMQHEEQERKIADLERQLAAERQNRKNSATSPGSQKDSGGQRQRDAYDDFFDAFNK